MQKLITFFAHGEDKFHEFQQNLFAVLAYSMWLNNNSVDLMEKLNELLFKISRKVTGIDEEKLIAVAKTITLKFLI